MREEEYPLESLMEYIEDERIKEKIDAIVIASKMMDLKIEIDFRPLSSFMIRIKSPNENILQMFFDVNYRKKYVKRISFSYWSKVERPNWHHYYDTEEITARYEDEFLTIVEQAYEKFGAMISNLK